MIICNLSLFTNSKDADDDPIMSPKNWILTPQLPFDEQWIPKLYPNLTAPGYLEGNVVILPSTSSEHGLRVLNVLRFNSVPLSNLAIILELDLTSYTLSFVSIIDFPGGMTKFTIRYDPVTRTYLTLCNPVTIKESPSQLNILSLSYTKDLEKLSEWHILADRLLYDDTGFTEVDSIRYTGFHYVDWQFDRLSSSIHNASCIHWDCDGGPDLIYLIRTSYRGANTFHNSNRITVVDIDDNKFSCSDIGTRSFFSLFNGMELTRLRSVILQNMRDKDLECLLERLNGGSLISLSIQSNEKRYDRT